MATNFLVGVAIKPVDCWSTKNYKSTTQQLCNLGFFRDDFSSIKIRKENESLHVRVLTREGQIVRLDTGVISRPVAWRQQIMELVALVPYNLVK